MADRYFVRVMAASRQSFAELPRWDLDLFHPTAREVDGRWEIEGLISMKDVARLVRHGYRVLVEDTLEARSRAREVVELDEWLRANRKDR